MKKVLFIFFQTPNKANGGVNSLVEIIANLKQVDPIVLTQSKTRVNERLGEVGVEVILTNKVSGGVSAKDVYSWVRFQFQLIKILLRNDFFAVHVNDFQSLLYSILVLKLSGLKVYFNLRGVFAEGIDYGIKWRLVNWCENLIVLSKEMKEQLLKRLPISSSNNNEDFVQSIYSIVDFDRFKPIVKNLDITNKRVLYVAAFSTLKNQRAFIHETKKWINRNSVHIDFVGDDNNDYGESCKQLVKELKLNEKITFHGYQKDISHFYHKADVTVVLSKREGLARCMIESLACGTPVVSFDVCSAKEILTDNNCGLVVAQGDYNQVCSHIGKLLGDKERYEQLSKNAVALANNLFNEDDIVSKYERIYL